MICVLFGWLTVALFLGFDRVPWSIAWLAYRFCHNWLAKWINPRLMWTSRILSIEKRCIPSGIHSCTIFIFWHAHCWWQHATIVKRWILWTKSSMGMLSLCIYHFHTNESSNVMILRLSPYFQFDQPNTTIDEKLLELWLHWNVQWRNNWRLINHSNTDQLATSILGLKLFDIVLRLVSYVTTTTIQLGPINPCSSKFNVLWHESDRLN